MPLAVAELPGHATQDLFAGGEIKEPINFPFRFDLIHNFGIVRFAFGTPLVLERKGCITLFQPNRHNRVIVLGDGEIHHGIP